jgi:hypothetical protein
LLAFAALAYGPSIRLPFMADDYVFLDHTLQARFTDLWSTKNSDFGWYRPWSREVHFWCIQSIAGPSEAAFRLVGVLLWITGLVLYAVLIGRVADLRTTVVACIGVSTLALWATTLLWISGSQDLWMIVFTMGSLLIFVSGRHGWAAVTFIGALLSKETAAVLPLILLGYCLLIEHRDLKSSFARTGVFWLFLFAWLALHPTLLSRLTHPEKVKMAVHVLAPHVAILKSSLATVNLDVVPRPIGITPGDIVGTILSAILVGALLAWYLRRGASGAGKGVHEYEPRALWRWGLWWAAAGWLPLLLPTTGWRAYYGCLGALGAWLAIAVWLVRWPRAAVTTVMVLALLRGADSKTMSWDWGEWFWLRSGSFLSAIRSELLREHPTLPPHTRIYLGRIPNNIGLIAGQSPALRVWYRDTTLNATFYSNYRPRGATEPKGEDLFFRFDSSQVLEEVVAGPEDIDAARRSNPEWEDDHEKLAMLFLRSGDTRRAAVEFEKLSLLTHRADAAVFASVCWSVEGDSARADSLRAAAQQRIKLSSSEMLKWVESLKATMPRVK